MKVQKTITVRAGNGDYYNFFNTPGSIGSLSNMTEKGWRLVFIKDDPENKQAVAVFEKDLKDDLPRG